MIERLKTKIALKGQANEYDTRAAWYSSHQNPFLEPSRASKNTVRYEKLSKSFVRRILHLPLTNRDNFEYMVDKINQNSSDDIQQLRNNDSSAKLDEKILWIRAELEQQYPEPEQNKF